MRYQGRGQKAENCRPLLTTYVYTWQLSNQISALCYFVSSKPSQKILEKSAYCTKN